mgnify:FL=1
MFTVESDTPERFGVLKFDGEKAVDIVEKPAVPPSKWAVSGIYFYSPDVFEVIKALRPSQRGELEITDVNRFYIKANLAWIVKMSGWWSDCGTIDTLLKTEELIKNDRLIQAVCPQRRG